MFKRPQVFIVVPVSREICISFYLIQVTRTGTKFRLSKQFYKENKVLFKRDFVVNQKQEQDLIVWGNKNNNAHTISDLGDEVFARIMGFPLCRETHWLRTTFIKDIVNILRYSADY